MQYDYMKYRSHSHGLSMSIGFLLQTAQFTRVTAESFKKGLEETNKRFK